MIGDCKMVGSDELCQVFTVLAGAGAGAGYLEVLQALEAIEHGYAHFRVSRLFLCVLCECVPGAILCLFLVSSFAVLLLCGVPGITSAYFGHFCVLCALFGQACARGP